MVRADPVRVGILCIRTALWVAIRSFTVRVVLRPFVVRASTWTALRVCLPGLVWTDVTPFATQRATP